MLHACLVSTLLCFVYTLRCFYMFSRTNLLTSCHSASCLFSAIFGSRKASKEIFSELDGTNVKVNYFPWGTRSPKGRRGGVPGWLNPLGAGGPYPTSGRVCPLWPPPRPLLRL